MSKVSNRILIRLGSGAHNLPTPGKCVIHRVPEKFHKMTEPSQYKPQVISIGPFHRKDQSLVAMEPWKSFYAHRLLARSSCSINSPAGTEKKEWATILDKCILSVEKMEFEIRKCYSECIDLKSTQFVEMMVIDGLFIIEMLISSASASGKCSHSDDHNPFYGNHWFSLAVRCDLLLLENQLPFSVIQCLFDALPDQLKKADGIPLSLPRMVLLYYCSNHTELFPNLKPHSRQYEAVTHRLDLEQNEAKHLLDFLSILLQVQPYSPHEDANMVDHNLPLSRWWKIKNSMKNNTVSKLIMTPLHNKFNKLDRFTYHSYNIVPSATNLKRAGVEFKMGSGDLSSVSMKFSSDGIFEISPIIIGDSTEIMLRNLIACEQSYSGRTDMTCYAHLMDSLINSVQDVEILCKVGIIKNYLGCEEDVSNIFNKLCVNATLYSTDRYGSITQDVNKYYRVSWHTRKAMLKREYFNSPWAVISFLAALLLILLTIISTVFGILQVVLPNKK